VHKTAAVLPLETAGSVPEAEITKQRAIRPSNGRARTLPRRRGVT